MVPNVILLSCFVLNSVMNPSPVNCPETVNSVTYSTHLCPHTFVNDH